MGLLSAADPLTNITTSFYVPCHSDIIPMQGKEKGQDKNTVQKDLTKLNEFGFAVIEMCAYVLKGSLYPELISCLTG